MQATHYIWPGSSKTVSVHINLDAIDKLLPEVLSGIGATPKRAAERGGILLGTVRQETGRSIVYVEDFKAVTCSHKFGPSFELSEEDFAGFDRAFGSVRPGGPSPIYAVGYYRSHTREGLSLSETDQDLMKDYFPAPANLALIIKPFATRTSTAGFFLREGGKFPEKSPKEFPFKSSELIDGPPAPKTATKGATAPTRPEPPTVVVEDVDFAREEAEPEPTAPPPQPRTMPRREPIALPKQRASWVPVSLVFLIIGVLLGVFVGPMLISKPAPDAGPANLSLDLSVSKSDQNLNVRWNGSSPVINAARSGTLEIEDSGATKPVDLDVPHLKNGAVVYPASPGPVKFKLTVHVGEKSSVTESVEWRP